MDGLTYLNRKKPVRPLPIFVVYGDDVFLRHQALIKVRDELVDPESRDLACSTYAGDKADWSTVRDELETPSFFGSRRLIVVENADSFVSEHRKRLEKYLDAQSQIGTLVLDVKTWSSTTNLAKLIDAEATIICKAPTPAKLVEWSRKWTKDQHDKELSAAAGRLLVDYVGPYVGLVAQELAKLAAYVGDAEGIEPADVDALVGNNRTENAFRIFGLIGQAKSRDALLLLRQILEKGDDPLRTLGAFGWFLSRLVKVSRLIQDGTSAWDAAREAGMRDAAATAQQLKHLGKKRIAQLYDWLLEVDLGIKGDSTLSPRALLERMVIRLAQPSQ